MQTEFTPLMSLIGGMLIGLSAVALMATNGRIAGIGGMLRHLLPPDIQRNNLIISSAFITGLIITVPLIKLLTGSVPVPTMVASPLMLIIAGLIVGLGAGTGNGCTSGHGVCGISRLSARSIVSTITFMVAAFITVYVLRHIIGVAA